MAEKPVKCGMRVEIIGKDVQGVVAFVGTTHFSSGKWIGVVLDEPKGKNNGKIQGKSYFQCNDNYGIFVRQSQLVIVDDDGMTESMTEVGSGEGSLTTSSTSGPSPATTPRTPTATALPIGDEKKSKIAVAVARTPTDSNTPIANVPTSEIPPSAQEDKLVRQMSTGGSTPGSKRASFVETNFVETVSYSPGVGGLEERMAALQQQQEMDALKNEVKDLNEKLETLKGKRAQDKEKLKEADKLKIQLQQLLEFKSKIMESQNELQRELQKSRQETQAAIDAKEQHAEEMSDLAEAVEMATLDKEMAEEKSETLQTELDQTKEKLEELQLDLEILKNEIADKGKEGASTNYQTKQLEQQNERLREALVKLRDMSAHDKQEHHRLQREVDRQKSDIAELSRTKEKLSAQIDAYEKQIVDLQEQVDAALGAEEMVEQLTERNLNLEEKLSDLQENVNDLETLHDMNEELQENARETELELREEVDMANGRVRELIRQYECAQETIADCEQTIQKFRELTESLRERSADLAQQLEKVTNTAVAPSTELFDFKIKFNETKAHAKAIEMELRRIEVQQLTQHINYLRAFMSDEFLGRGGDHDAVLVLLLIPRIVWKAEILINQIREKYPAPESITTDTVLKGHNVEQHSFSNHFIFLLLCLQNLLQQFISALNSCSVEVFLKLGGLYPEMAVQEKAVDFYLELLKKDQLDENVILEPLEKSLAYFQHSYGVHLIDERVDCTVLMSYHTKLVIVACEAISVELLRLQTLLQPGQDSSDMALLYKDLDVQNNDLKQMTKKMRRRLPQEGGPNPISFEKEVKAQLLECNLHVGRVLQTLREFGQAAVQQALVSEGSKGLSSQKLKELAHQASDKVYGKDDCGPIDCLRQSMTILSETMSKVAGRVQGGEFDFDGTPEPLPQPPIKVRSQNIKAEIKDVQNLKLKLEAKEVDLVESKKLLKLKHEELSELTVRKDMLEKKLDVVVKENAQKLQELQNKLQDTTRLLKKKEKEFEETMDHLQADIDSLENERGELKEKLKSISKKALFENLTKTTAMISSPTSPTTAVPTIPPLTSARDSPMLVQQLYNVRMALQNVKEENNRLKSRLMKHQLSNLPPLTIPRKPTGLSSVTGLIPLIGENTNTELEAENEDNQLNSLCRKTNNLLKELKTLSVSASVVDLSKRKAGTEHVLDKSSPAQHLIDQVYRKAKLESRADKLKVEVANFLAAGHPGGSVRSDFSGFPTPQYTKVMEENQSGYQCVGRIRMPAEPGSGCKTIPVVLNASGLKQLHHLLSAH